MTECTVIAQLTFPTPIPLATKSRGWCHPQFGLPIPVTVIKIIPHRQAQRHVRRGPWTQGHSAIDTCCQRGNQFSLMDSYWLLSRPMLIRRWLSQNEVGGIFVDFCIHFWHILSYCFFACLLCFWFWVLGVFFFFWDRARGREWENTCKVVWVGMWDDLRRLGRRETQSKYSIKKTLMKT